MEIGSNLGTVSTTTTVLLQRQEDDWDEQQKTFEEVERWEKIGKKKLPSDLRDGFLQYLSNYSGFLRMPVYKMLDSLDWEHTRLSQFYAVLLKLPRDSMTPLVSLLESFIPYNIVLVCLSLFYEFKDYQVEELVMHTDRSDVHLLIQVCRHLPVAELEALVELANRLTLRDIIILLKRCDEPLAKHCALCRTRRLHALEQRMIHEQVPDGMIKVPGTLPLYAKETVWSADDEKGFVFDLETAEITWYKYPVDLIRICDKCLLDVNQAITNNNRFEEIHQIDASIRKGAIRNLRDHEKGMAQVIYKLSHERSNRRGREFALRALEYQRKGLTKEETERKRQALEEERRQHVLRKQQEHEALVAASLTVDQKWIHFDQQAEFKRLDMRQAYTEVKQRFDYELNTGRAPKDRLHARTWHLAPISGSGKALLPEGAAQIFGTYIHPVINHDAELSAWKEKADIGHRAYLKKQADIKKARQDAIDKEVDRLCNHVKERMAELQFTEELAQQARLKAEQERLKKRAEDRVKRRELRFEQYLEAERDNMIFEDSRSYKFRDYEWQLLHEHSEREDMFNEEMEQTEFDRFWGFDLFEAMQNQEEERLRKMYEDRVIYFNKLMAHTRSVKPIKKYYSFKHVGTLPEDHAYSTELERRCAVIKKLKAEEVRSKLNVRVSYSYS